MKYAMSPPPLTVFYSPAYVVEGKAETVTKARLVAELIEAGKAGEVRLKAPKFATRKELVTIHAPEHVRSTFEDEGSFLEVGAWSQPLLDSILASTGGMRDAVREALLNGRSGSLSSGLHHARRDAGNGFCQFNGLALAALEALKKVRTVGTWISTPMPGVARSTSSATTSGSSWSTSPSIRSTPGSRPTRIAISTSRSMIRAVISAMSKTGCTLWKASIS